MKRSVFYSALCVGVLTSNAFAYDLAIKGQVHETVEGSNNYFLEQSPNGVTIKSLSAMNLDVLAQTPTTRYLLNTYYSYYRYFGPGAENLTLNSGTPAHANFSVDHTTQLSTYRLGVAWTRADIATTQLAQTGQATSSGSTNTYRVNGGVTHDLSRIDSVSWFNTASTSSSDDPGFTPYFNFTSVLSWNHTLSQTTALNSSVNFDWYSADNEASSQRLFWKLLTGLDTRLTRRLTFSGHVGLAFVNAWQNGVAQTTAIPPLGVVPFFQPLVGSANSLLWDAEFGYALLKGTHAALFARQTIFPTITGQLSKSESFGLTLSHAINRRSNLHFLTQFTQSTQGQGGTDFSSLRASKSNFVTASIDYDYQLARHWRANLSYIYRQRNDEGGTGGTVNSSTVLVGLNYDFDALGNPTPINVAARERARARARSTAGYVFPLFR